MTTSEHDARPLDRDVFGRVSTKHQDWSHRRGEPRVFALLWVVFLMIVTVWMFQRADAFVAFDPDSFRPAARAAIAGMMVGICVFWPVLRLTQVLPERPLAAAGKDLLIVGLTTQALIWPQVWLSELGFSVTLALSLSVAGWTTLTAAVIALATERWWGGRGTFPQRAFGVCACIALAFGGMIAAAGAREDSRDPLRSRALWMGSPMTSVHEITRDRPWRARAGSRLTQSRFAEVGDVHAKAVLALWFVAGAAWICAAALSRSEGGPSDEHTD